MLTAQLGAGPLALARAQRAQTARVLIETTDLGLAEIAFAAGFGSVRQFNDTISEVYGVAPSTLRAVRSAAAARPEAGAVSLRLAYRPPLHAAALLEFLAARAIARRRRGRATARTAAALRLPHGTATAELTPRPGYVAATLRLADVRDLAPAVARCRRLFDLDADPEAVDAMLAADPALAAVVAKEPGVRVPRAVDGFEIAVRAIVGQQISVAGARPATGRSRRGLVSPRTRRLPRAPEELLGARRTSAFGMPTARRETIRGAGPGGRRRPRRPRSRRRPRRG